MHARSRIDAVAEALGAVPMHGWHAAAQHNPEWRHFRRLARTMPHGPFATLITAVGLNAYQLKGDPEHGYWRPIPALVAAAGPIRSRRHLHRRLLAFYARERLPRGKIRRLDRFFASPLARRLWQQTPRESAAQLNLIWQELARTMGQKPHAKTVSFALKCLAVSILIAGTPLETFPAPIPVDNRVAKLSRRLRFRAAGRIDRIQTQWQNVLARLARRRPGLTMIQLDSLLWQIAPLDERGLIRYFQKWNAVPAARALLRLMRG
ncbi:MAG: N-glycosylase/DNA lyase [Kiritimatiellae bacterium]|nr:N-glycosylase/DNA lyase [Kiritimatiellia bacterium]